MEKYIETNDILQYIYGISSDEVFDYVLVAPAWEIEKLVGDIEVEIKQLINHKFSNSYEVKVGDKRILYVRLQIGAPNIVDFCLSCYKLKCDNFIFLGSAGSLVKDISLGDCIIPSCAISGNGATMYLNDTLKDKFLQKAYSNEGLNQKLVTACTDTGFNVLDEVVISVDSVFAEYSHLNEFRSLGASVIEMEFASFLECMRVINKKGSALLLISDNSANGEHLASDTRDPFNKYKNNRSKVFDVISRL